MDGQIPRSLTAMQRLLSIARIARMAALTETDVARAL